MADDQLSGFGERVLAVIDEGRRVSTYKLARGWIEVARSEDIRSKPVAVHGPGCDLVCYRSWSGRLHVVDGACPHMGVSFARHGIVDGEGIRCRFHGWAWDGQGRHVRMTWQGRAMAMFDLRNFPVREVDGRVWIRLPHEGGPLLVDE